MTSRTDPDPPTCRELVVHASAYLDGELDDGTRTRIEAHLTRCTDCGAYVEQLRMTVRLLGEVAPERVTPELEQRLLDAFRAFRREQGG